MNDLRTELDQLTDKRLDYVRARSMVNSDAQGYKDANIPKTTFYSWPEEERDRLNEIAQRLKRETLTRAMIVLQDAAEEAAKIKVAGLTSADEKIKQAAASEILDRNLGRPAQSVDLTSDGKPLPAAQILVYLPDNGRDNHSPDSQHDQPASGD